MCGDFNINILDNYIKTNDYLNILASRCFLSCINGYTRVVNNSATCIDHIFVKNIAINKIDPIILKCDITDHFATIIYIDIGKISNTRVKNNLKQYNIIDFVLLNNLLKNENWSCLSNNNDVDSLINIFNNKFNYIINLSSNIKYPYLNSNKSRKLKECMTRGLLVSIRHKEKLSFKLKKSPFNSILKKNF